MITIIGCVEDPEPVSSGETRIEVWDATQWTSGTPTGVPSSNATVSLYRSQKDFTNNNPYTQSQTNANGVAIFKGLTVGNYFLEVSKGDKSNLFQKSPAPINGYYMGLKPIGIFQSQAEINSAMEQPEASPGDIKFFDQNADGLINDYDKIPLPTDLVSVQPGSQNEIMIHIGYNSGQRLQEQVQVENYLKIGNKEYSLDYGKINYTNKLNPAGYAMTLMLATDGTKLNIDNKIQSEENGTSYIKDSEIVLTFYFHATDFMGLPSGTYINKSPKNPSIALGTWDVGEYFETRRNTDGTIENLEDGFFRSGEVIINRSYENYEIIIDCTDNKGKKVTGYYKGKVSYMDT
ncbi:carboxypeptidase-like regulatory domain-containing protein [Echinicola jeungdonensis]|uniref:Carboxypeptidase-like regulatory domain-containing protein n=1 Tax=Echinicola jeungdonensis TaxID=709343 RepID=A0ABV5J7I7_9BACT|nr:carboxypeptidase-like regulatory domain-containing protein [Echinicola jeungdonensis]MDN3671036.1 carboxypeptidase-like regulatory domain-containing protein [Echinicola jeungdonensis]